MAISLLSRLFHYLQIIVGICLLALTSGCGLPESEKNPRFVMVLVDETESFALYKEGKITTMFWPETLPWIAKIVTRLQPGERFCVIGIDEHGFDTDDVRIDYILDEGFMRAAQEKIKIVQKVKELTRRKERHRSTDILGALYHAAYFLNKQDTHRGMIVIFSDMIQEPEIPTLKDAVDLNFPKGTEVYCFYVNASGRENWEKIVNIWLPIFKAVGLETTKDCFSQRGEISIIFNKLFQE